MAREVDCIVLGKPAAGLDFPPWPGELGQRIFDCVSKEAWQTWLAHQTMLINEHNINPMNPSQRKFIEQEMEKFFFGEGSTTPQGFVAPE
ncbi:MAG: oxidative damage protection protein [Pseudomonadales bacterium]